MGSVAENILRLQDSIEECKATNGGGDVLLVAVTKTVDTSLMQEAYNCGIKEFGENRVQEFLSKKDSFSTDINWNLIGRLQTNKVKYIIDNNIALIHSLDRLSLAEEIQKQAKAANKKINALLQVNVSLEESKTGVFEEEIDEFLDKIKTYDCLTIKGIMTIAPISDDSKYLRKLFARTKEIYEKYKTSDFEYLSMGMSADYKEAILEGSNMIRVGSAIFAKQ